MPVTLTILHDCPHPRILGPSFSPREADEHEGTLHRFRSPRLHGSRRQPEDLDDGPPSSLRDRQDVDSY